MADEGLGRLRRCEDDDLLRMLEWRNHPATRQMMYSQHEISLDEHHAWWSRTRDRDDASYFMFMWRELASGVVAFTEISHENGTAFWAFYADPLAPPGTGSRMEMAALDYAFGEAGLRKLSCEVLDRNRRVLRLHRRFGFYEEGLFREHVRIGDTFETVHRLAMFRTTWREMRATQALRLKQWRWRERDARRD